MEKKNRFCYSYVTVLLKMTLCLCIYFVLKKHHYFKPFKIDTLSFTMYILANLTCLLKTYVILSNLISMIIFFIIKDHSFYL